MLVIKPSRDAATAGVMAVGVVLGSLLVARAGAQRSLDLLGLACLLAACIPLAWRRARPVPVALAAATACVAYYALLYPGIFAAAPVLLAVYTVVSLGRRLAGVGVAVGFVVAFYVAIAVARSDFDVHDGVWWNVGFLIAVAVIGQLVADHRAYLRVVEQRAAEAERTREESALRRASEERLWIAQELHDTLTHTISVINVQAGVAAHLIDRNPEQLRPALAAIKEAGQEAMRELRATLGVLRQADADGGEPGLDRLPQLVSRTAAAGLPITFEIRGEPRPLAPPADRAAYRIAQEALTNVLRHAGTASVTMICDYHRDTLTLSLHDNGTVGARDPEMARGPGTAQPGQGIGLIGMRERAVAVGGQLTAGPSPAGGFLVEAQLPLQESA